MKPEAGELVVKDHEVKPISGMQDDLEDDKISIEPGAPDDA